MTKREWAKDGLILLIFFLTFFLYYQPQLDQQRQQLELLRKQVEANLQVQVTLSPSDGWTTVGNSACAVVRPNTLFTFQITNTVGRNLTVLKVAYLASDWPSKNSGGWSTGPQGPNDSEWNLRPGNVLTSRMDWGFDPTSYGTPGNRADFSITIVTVELPPQTNTYCILYSK